MKFTINQISQGKEEVILNYKEMNEEVAKIVAFFRNEGRKIIGWKDKTQVVIKRYKLFPLQQVNDYEY